MQDIHSIGGGSRLFDGGGGDRRLRPHNHNHHNYQELKCPRCDSLNTKFCYYNNYNLSQPRHFCKGCRRYWTKGGVLRNVPVGGGCRKTKRAKAMPSSGDASSPPRAQQQQQQEGDSNSSSESSNLTAVTNTTTATTACTIEAVSVQSASSASNNLLNNSITEPKFFPNANPNPSFQPSLLEPGSDCGIFKEMGSFTSLITSSNEQMSFGFEKILNQQELEQNRQLQEQEQMMMMSIGGEELKMEEQMGAGFDQTVSVELSTLQNTSGNGDQFGSLDWQGCTDQGWFDVPNTVDHAYWNQSQWTDQNQPNNLYFP